MDNKNLKAVIFENVTKMRAMGLKGAPFITEENESVLLEVWAEALSDSGFTDADAGRIAKCWRAMRRTAQTWFTPAALVASIRSMPESYKPNALEHRSDEMNAEGLKKIRELMASTGLRVASNDR